MEKMPFRDAQEVVDVQAVMASAAHKVTTSDWRQAWARAIRRGGVLK